MSAEIVLLKHPDIRIETNPQVVVCEAVLAETISLIGGINEPE